MAFKISILLFYMVVISIGTMLFLVGCEITIDGPQTYTTPSAPELQAP